MNSEFFTIIYLYSVRLNDFLMDNIALKGYLENQEEAQETPEHVQEHPHDILEYPIIPPWQEKDKVLLYFSED